MKLSSCCFHLPRVPFHSMLFFFFLPVAIVSQAPQDVVKLLRVVDSLPEMSSPKPTEDLFEKGIAQVEDTALFIGVRNRRTNVSGYCGDLASFHLKGSEEEKFDAFLYKPQSQLNGVTGLITLAVPQQWFRQSTMKQEVTLFICLGDHNRLSISTLRVRKEQLVKKDGWMLLVHKVAGAPGLQIRSAALILDQKWNNAFLLPKNSFTALVVKTMDVKKRKTFNALCDVTKGVNQECCLWPFYKVQPNGRKIRFHRCVGEVGYIGRPDVSSFNRIVRSSAKRRNDKKISGSTTKDMQGKSIPSNQSVSIVRSSGNRRAAHNEDP